jgi:Concanavalin A-like lectin/glucanases superfamily/Bacterial Ig domain/Purple acid Phosphatase, N-terminal domain
MKILTLILYCSLVVMIQSGFAADEIHWTTTGQTSVTFDWRGASTENTIRYGLSPGTYPNEVTASTPSPLPTSSTGPFWEAKITGLQEDTLYYYKIANAPEHTFRTPPHPGDSDFIVYAVGDMGSSLSYSRVVPVQNIIGNVYGNGYADFSLAIGDLTYADNNGAIDVDQHFNDVMLWSQDAAYMPAWGNHEWNTSTSIPDHLNNYEGRFDFPNSMTSPGASAAIGNGPGEDWYWFDYGNVRFIAFPEPYSGAWTDWNTQVKSVMAAAQSNPSINYIVTYGHRPSYSSSTPGNTTLKGILDGLALLYPKYVLDLSGHVHDYERTDPSQTVGVTHVVVGTGHTAPGTITTTKPPWSVYRATQPGALKLHFATDHIDGEFICAPVSSTCSAAGAVLDSFTIGTPDTTPPTVGISAPVANATVSGIITVSASATDNVRVAGVQFKLDGINLGGEISTAPFSISWNTATVANGAHTITAVARDASGNMTTASNIPIVVNNSSVVDTISPTVGMTAPAANATVSGTANVSATASDNVGVVGVQFKLDGANLGTEDTAAPYSFSWNTASATNGSYALTAVARDAAGNVATSGTLSVTVNNSVVDTIPPTVGMTAPAVNATVSGTISVSANATDNVSVAGVQFKLDGANLGGEITTTPYSVSWNTNTAANGVHNLTAVARDAAGNITTSSTVSVTVNNTVQTGNATHQWTFDESSGTTALDSAGSNNAALSNALWVAGHTGNAASFNGTNASGTAGTIDFGTGNFTIAHWVNVTAFKNFAGIFNNRSSTGTNLGFHTRTDGTSTFTALIDFGATSKNVAVTNAVTGTWYHVAVSVDRAGFMKLYVNGAFVGQVDISAFSATSITNTDSVRIGRDQSTNYYSGAVDDLSIYNSVLSATEILNIYNQ